MHKVLKYLALGLALGLLAVPFYAIPAEAAGLILVDGSTSGGGAVDSTHTISGTGFTAGDSIAISYDSQPLTTTPTLTSIIGTSFSASITIPASPSGIVHTITATGTPSGVSASAGFNVTPKITVSAASALIGTSITVTGSGYQNAETSIITTFDGSVTLGIDQTASASGAWINTFNVPNISPGAHTIHAKGVGAVDATVNFTVIAPPRIGISLSRGNVGAQVTVSGTNFSPNETGISVSFGSNQLSSSTSANASGAWTLQFGIPELPSGVYSVSAAGNTTQPGAAANVNFTVTPSIDVNPQAGPAGTSVTVSGTGFGASESNIAITFDGADQGSSVKADANGSWSNTFSVPVSAGGSHNISAHGARTLAASIAPVPYRVGAGISINKNSGPPGIAVNVSGNGFAINETSIVISFDGTQVATATANASGNWTASVTIPAAAGGDHAFTARGRTTTTASGTTFNITPDLSIDKSSGTSGTTITLKGNGFAANETGIALTYDGAKVGQTVTAGANGSWTASFQVPPSSSGTHLIGVSGSVTQIVGSADLNFKVAATVFLNQSTGFPGSPLIVSGSGFAGASTLQITFDDNPIYNVGAVSSDQAGNFNKTITVPVAKAGSHVIKVIDAQNNADSKTFTIDGTPPAVPKITSPTDSARQGFFGGIRPTFKWVAVTDPRGEGYTKGVTYELQIDTNSDFTDPIVDLPALTKTSVTLGQSDALPKGDYFWRVRAIDAASNQGNWSPAFSLTSGLISGAVFWPVLILILIGASIALYFLVLRRALAGRRPLPAAQVAPEIVIPEVVNPEYRITEGDGPARKALPWRLALPQAAAAAKGQRSFSAEDQARLRTAVDFARSLPLAEPGPNTEWLVGLAESVSGNTASPELYSQIVNGEIEMKYDPAWMHHPSYDDLQSLLEGQPILADLEGYIDAVNQSATDAVILLQDVYRSTSGEVSSDIFANGGWDFISGIYADAVNWYRGRYLREPSEKDYSVKPASGAEPDSFSLSGEQNTSFPGRLILTSTEAEAAQMRALHLKLRRTYRGDERARELAKTVSQLEIQRKRILNAFSQFGHIGD